jgi:hypothetical protein
MKHRLSLAALAAALGAVVFMSGCVVPVGRYDNRPGYYGDGGRQECRGREDCDHRDFDHGQR